MHLSSARRLWFIGSFLMGALLLGGLEYSVVASTSFRRQPDPLTLAVTLDLLLGIPLLYYLLIVRPLAISPVTLVASGLAAVGLANLILPSGHHQYIQVAERLLVLAELGVVALAVHRLRRIQAAYQRLNRVQPDFMSNLEQAMSQVMGQLPGLPWLVGELAVLRYTFLGPWIKPEVRPGQRAFTLYQESGITALGIGLLLVGGIEMGLIHLLLVRWQATVAWVLFGLSLYSMLIVMAYLVSLRKRPILLTGTWLRLRVGFFWRADIPLMTIRHAERVRSVDERLVFDDLSKVVGSTPNVLIHLREPVPLTGLYQPTRPTQTLGLFLDDPDAFVQALTDGSTLDEVIL